MMNLPSLRSFGAQRFAIAFTVMVVTAIGSPAGAQQGGQGGVVPVAQAAPVGGHTRRARLVGVRDLGATLQVDGVVDAPASR